MNNEKIAEELQAIYEKIGIRDILMSSLNRMKSGDPVPPLSPEDMEKVYVSAIIETAIIGLKDDKTLLKEVGLMLAAKVITRLNSGPRLPTIPGPTNNPSLN